jgi:mannose-1-phosphate guanylyltransferase
MPKCLVPIRGRPLLGIWLERLQNQGVAEVLVNTHHHAKQVESFVRGLKSKLVIRLEHEPVLLGSGGTIWAHQRFVQKEEDFWIIYGDNLSLVDLEEMHRYHQTHTGLMTLGLFHAENPSACGIALLDAAGKVVEFEEKPQRPAGDLANAGFYLARAEIFREDIWAHRIPLDFGYHVLPQLKGKMYGYIIEEYHTDIGSLEAYSRAQEECPETLLNTPKDSL